MPVELHGPAADPILEDLALPAHRRSRGHAASARRSGRAASPATGASTLAGLRQREALLRLALEAGRLAVWDWDVRSGRVAYAVFEGYDEHLHGHPVDPTFVEVRAEDWGRSSHPDDADTQEAARRVVDGGVDTFPTLYRRRLEPGGPWEWVETSGRAVSRDREGRALRIVGTVGRVMARVEQDAEQRRREFELTQAIRLSSVAEVASALGHELNQPLAAAMAGVQSAQRLLRRRGGGTEKALVLLERSVECIERAAAIVRQHRQASRPRGGGGQRIDLRESAEQMCAMFEADTRRREIRLVVMPSPLPCEVRGNRAQIEQVLANLVRNGIEAVATVPGPPRRVTITMRRTKTTVQLRVSDSGPGVAPAVQASLFLPYFTTKREGTGLGLALSRSIAEAHQGRLVLESGQSGQTTFLLELPRPEARWKR
jgi:signal transduction histidine kinase